MVATAHLVEFITSSLGLRVEPWQVAFLDRIDGAKHVATIARIRIGLGPLQLTTGCTCRDAPGWYPGRPVDRGCPVHGQPAPAVEPCRCRYGLRPVDGVPGMWPLDAFGHYTRARGVYAFRIHPKCPHHGDLIRDLAADELLHERVLDEAERTGH